MLAAHVPVNHRSLRYLSKAYETLFARKQALYAEERAAIAERKAFERRVEDAPELADKLHFSGCASAADRRAMALLTDQIAIDERLEEARLRWQEEQAHPEIVSPRLFDILAEQAARDKTAFGAIVEYAAVWSDNEDEVVISFAVFRDDPRSRVEAADVIERYLDALNLLARKQWALDDARSVEVWKRGHVDVTVVYRAQ